MPERQPYEPDTSGGPSQLLVQLLANPNFRQMFADHVYKDLTTVLSSTTAAAMYQAEANRIWDPATGIDGVLDESARWGNVGELAGTWNELGTPATWLAHIDEELNSWFPVRTAIMFSQFETAMTFQPVGGSNSYTYTMYPGVTPPVLYLNGNQESYGASVSIVGGNTLTMREAPAGAAIYYTTDGNDPLESELNLTLASITITGTTATATAVEYDRRPV